ncbi:hypothetical protein U2F10_02820 [Leptothoe sp. EHU-05/26/07-4]
MNTRQSKQISRKDRLDVHMGDHMSAWFGDMVMELGYTHGEDRPAYRKFFKAWYEGKYQLVESGQVLVSAEPPDSLEKVESANAEEEDDEVVPSSSKGPSNEEAEHSVARWLEVKKQDIPREACQKEYHQLYQDWMYMDADAAYLTKRSVFSKAFEKVAPVDRVSKYPGEGWLLRFRPKL